VLDIVVGLELVPMFNRPFAVEVITPDEFTGCTTIEIGTRFPGNLMCRDAVFATFGFDCRVNTWSAAVESAVANSVGVYPTM